jgi:phosphatidylserine decarboxylase
MGATSLIVIAASVCGAVLVCGFLFWRYVWFFRNPDRDIPSAECIVSPADGTVVYVKEIAANEEVITIKQGTAATVRDIVREDVGSPKLLIGIFMSPFNVHYNRAPVCGIIEKITHYEPLSRNLHMGPMHFRTLLHLQPLYRNSRHIIENERTVTRIRGRYKERTLRCYVVQIAGKNVSGIDSFRVEGALVDKGEVFGMIRIGSQVDLVLPRFPEMQIRTSPGDRIRAGESILVE